MDTIRSEGFAPGLGPVFHHDSLRHATEAGRKARNLTQAFLNRRRCDSHHYEKRNPTRRVVQ